MSGKWVMFDPDFGVFYRTPNGTIASVEELADNPDLITNPIDPAGDQANLAYSQLTRDIYASTQDNRVSDTPPTEPEDVTLILPQQSEFYFPVATDPEALSYAGENRPKPIYYTAQINIPSVAVQIDLHLPLVVVGISGNGQVFVGGQILAIGSPELKNYFARFARDGNYTDPVNFVTVFPGATNVLISMSVSPFVVDGGPDGEAEIYHPNTLKSHGGSTLYRLITQTAGQPPSSRAKIFMGIAGQLFDTSRPYVSPYDSGVQLTSF